MGLDDFGLFSYGFVIYKLSCSIDGIQIQMLKAPAVEEFANTMCDEKLLALKHEGLKVYDRFREN